MNRPSNHGNNNNADKDLRLSSAVSISHPTLQVAKQIDSTSGTTQTSNTQPHWSPYVLHQCDTLKKFGFENIFLEMLLDIDIEALKSLNNWCDRLMTDEKAGKFLKRQAEFEFLKRHIITLSSTVANALSKLATQLAQHGITNSKGVFEHFLAEMLIFFSSYIYRSILPNDIFLSMKPMPNAQKCYDDAVRLMISDLKSKLPKIINNIYNILLPYCKPNTELVFDQIKIITDPIKFDISVELGQNLSKAHLFKHNDAPISRRVSI